MYDVKRCEIASSHQICDEDSKSIITITLLCGVITTASEMFLFDHCRSNTQFVIVVIVRLILYQSSKMLASIGLNPQYLGWPFLYESCMRGASGG